LLLVDGTCYGLEAGDRVVALVVGPCDGYGSSDASSGWFSARTMLIMEMVPPQATLGMQQLHELIIKL